MSPSSDAVNSTDLSDTIAVQHQQHQSSDPRPGLPSGQGNAPFACNVCKRTYTRVDHLARHYRSHTREKPFACEVCGKEFARADLLRRHAAGHNDGTSNKRKRQPSPSTRVSIACAACAAAKLKCKEDKPCRRCQKKGIDCVMPTQDHALQKGHRPSAAPAEERTPALQRPSADGANVASHVSPRDGQQQQRPEATSQAESQHGFNFPNPDYPTLSLTQAEIIPRAETFQDQHLSTDPMINDGWYPQDSSLGDFLADIMVPISPANIAPSDASVGAPDMLLKDVLDFGIDASFDLNDFDFGLLNSCNSNVAAPYHPMATDDLSYPPSRNEEAQGPEVHNLTVEAFQRSVWRWTPGRLDQGHGEQMNLSLPSNVGVTVAHTERPCEERLAQPARDKIMAMLFNTCEQTAISRIASQFPSAEVLDGLMQNFLLLHASRSDSFIHVPTFQPNSMKPELVAMTVAYASVRNVVPVIRKLGFALQEAVRLALPKAFEKDNSMTRDLQLLQAYFLELDAGLWSGNKRKMEIAESHGLPLITMLRRSGRFRKLRPIPAAPTVADTPESLDRKWRTWVEVESFKRLAYSITIYDSQLSMSFLVPPLVTYGEKSLDLPASAELWTAKTATAWRDAYLLQGAKTAHRLPTLTLCVHDVHAMLDFHDQIHLHFSVDIVLSLFWNLLWEARQLNSLAKQHSTKSITNMTLVSGHWQHELAQTLRNFRIAVADAEPLSPAAMIVHEHLLLNVYVSFEELSLFAGKEGASDARRVLPLLRQWADNKDSRQAAWHAGQIVRVATTFAPDTLRDFYAIALYHAGLTLWAYGLLSDRPSGTKPRRPRSDSISRTSVSSDQLQDTVFLDGHETSDTSKFIVLNRAKPVIRRWPLSRNASGENAIDAVSLHDPQAVMETVISVLQLNYGAPNRTTIPPLVDNLTSLMQDLSRAASKLSKKR